jgi:hypothetical protein
MNDTTKVEDRFHTEPKATKPVVATMKFLPEGKQVHEVKQKHLKFTYEKNYPVLERGNYRIKTVDDTGRELWMKEDYFTNANTYLLADKELGFTGPVDDNKLSFTAPDYSVYGKSDPMPDVRKVSFVKKEFDGLDENRLKTESVMQGDLSVPKKTAADFDAGTTMFEYKALSGIPIPKSCATGRDNPPAERPCMTKDELNKVLNLKSEKTVEELQKNKEYFEKVSAPLNSSKTTKENPLLNDMDRLWEKMGTVFPEYRKIDSDGFMTFVKSHFPGRRIEWKCGVLTVDGATTKINKSEVNDAFTGLKNLATPKVADKMVGRLVVKKLKKLF